MEYILSYCRELFIMYSVFQRRLLIEVFCQSGYLIVSKICRQICRQRVHGSPTLSTAKIG
jgi:hypothetical protein